MSLTATGGAVEIVTSGQRLAEVVEEASRRPRVALDLEANGFHRYPERICLLQLASPESVFLIDPLAIPDVSPIGGLLADPSVEVVMHSADYDVRSLDREWGFRVRNLFDTSIASAFVGSEKLGLGAVLEEYLDVSVNKSKKLQRADWTKRPLSPEAQRYAAEDVYHLERLRDLLAKRLADLGRPEWVQEECERQTRVRFRPRDPEWAFASLKGSRALDGRGLAVLRELHRYREQEAVRMDRPPFKIMSDAALVDLAASPRSDLAGIKSLGRYRNPPASRGLHAAIRDGLRARPVTRPASSVSTPRLTASERASVSIPRLTASERAKVAARLKRVKEWRSGLGQELRLDPALLWPAASLEVLARSPGDLGAELEGPNVRAWQRREFGESLRSFLAGLN